MTRLLALTLGLLLFGACTEYDLVGDGEVSGQPNPPTIGPDVVTDRFVQTTVAAVDVLWVIDTSCSMSEEQARLNSNFQPFMTYFLDSGLDYHIGVVSTNMDAGATMYQGRLHGAQGYKWIDPATPNPIDVFRGMSLMGTDDHYDEKGREAAYFALVLRRDTDNAGFYRDDANLAVITISDEDDYSSQTYITHQGWIDWLKSAKPSEGQVTSSSIVGPQIGAYGTCPGAVEPGSKYLDVTRKVGGIEWSICDNDWEGALELLGMQAAGLKREFFLSDVPILDSLSVWVDDDEGNETEFVLDEDYEYLRARNSIRFKTFIPEPLSQIYVEYQILEGFQ